MLAASDPSPDEPAFLSAYEKAGAEDLDPRCVPQTLDQPPPVGDAILYPGYSEIDQETWRMLYARQLAFLPGRASAAYLHGAETITLGGERIPALKDLSARLARETNWAVARVPGLLHERDFFELLSQRIFPSTDYIRGREELDYTPAPDLFHDIFGHMPMLTEPDFADFYQHFGEAALNATGYQRVQLERLHWFSVEFGLIREQQPDGSTARRIFGAGILSSHGEVQHALSDAVEVRPYDVAVVAEQDYDVWHLQPLLFELDSFEQLVDQFGGWAKAQGLR
ncbi:MAG: phenylalanine 4-monooxygenase [Rhodothermales bacterium]|nr:phenylalanine 4-monooxygenase [Rhodothermales bacterium]